MAAKSDDLRNWHPVTTMTDKDASELDVIKDRDWLNPISMSTLKRAVERKDKKVMLNGDEFTISYGHVTKLPITGDRPCVMLKRTDEQFIMPFGYVALETLKNFRFEDRESNRSK